MRSMRAVRFARKNCLILAIGLAGLPTGCASQREQLREALRQPLANQYVADLSQADSYRVAYPDRIRVEIADSPQLGTDQFVSVDGKIVLGNTQLQVEGLNSTSIRRQIAQLYQIPSEQVRVMVVEYRSRVLLLDGAVKGGTHHIDYRGPETVLQVLERAGGLTLDADLRQISLVRANVAAGKPEERFTIDLEQIFLRGDATTNITVLPNDEIRVGETRRANLAKIFPRWMMPIYNEVRGWIPGQSRKESPEDKK